MGEGRDDTEPGVAKGATERGLGPPPGSDRMPAVKGSPVVVPPPPPEAPVIDTVPTAPPKMTLKMPASLANAHATGGSPSPGPQRAAVPYTPTPPRAFPVTPQPFSPHAAPANTSPLNAPPVPGAPPTGAGVAAAAPRRAAAPTIIVRRYGPSTGQKLAAFIAMLVLVTACGIAVIVLRQPQWLGLEKPASPTAQVPAATSPPPAVAAGEATPGPASAAPAPALATVAAPKAMPAGTPSGSARTSSPPQRPAASPAKGRPAKTTTPAL